MSLLEFGIEIEKLFRSDDNRDDDDEQRERSRVIERGLAYKAKMKNIKGLRPVKQIPK